jgi:hypothetical protein
MACAYCKAHPPAAGETPAAHTDIRRCPRAGALCGTCKTKSAVCVAGVCRKLCTRCNQVGHAKKHCPQKPAAGDGERHCGHCGAVGHQSNHCPVRKQAEGAEALRSKCRKCGQAGHNIGTCPQVTEDERAEVGKGAGRPVVAALDQDARRRLAREINPDYDRSGNRIGPGGGQPGFTSAHSYHEHDPSLVGYQFQPLVSRRFVMNTSRRDGMSSSFRICSITTEKCEGFAQMPRERRVRVGARVLEHAQQRVEQDERGTTEALDAAERAYREQQPPPEPEETALPAPEPRHRARRQPGYRGFLRAATTQGAAATRPRGCQGARRRASSQDIEALTGGFDRPDVRSQEVKAGLQSVRLQLAAREAADAAHAKAMTEDYDQTMRRHEELKRKASSDDLVRRLDAHRAQKKTKAAGDDEQADPEASQFLSSIIGGHRE